MDIFLYYIFILLIVYVCKDKMIISYSGVSRGGASNYNNRFIPIIKKKKSTLPCPTYTFQKKIYSNSKQIDSKFIKQFKLCHP